MDRLASYLHTNQLDLVQSEDPVKGRSIYTKCLIRRGSTVITSQPLGTVPFQDHKREICNYCFQKSKNQASRQQCSRCKSAYFCSPKCFKNAWMSYHQHVCDDMTTNPADKDDQDLEMLERVALNTSRFHDIEAQQPSTTTEEAVEDIHVTMQAFFSLMDHSQNQARHVLARYERIADRALRKQYMQGEGFSRSDLVQLLCRFKCNNFSITDENLFAVGEGTYPIGSLFNHSCRPNAVALFEGALLKVVAIDDILENTEVTIAYIDAAHSRTYRKKTLHENYFFNCDCVRCHGTAGFGQIDTMLGEESEWDRAQAALDDESSAERQNIRKSVETWDLVEMIDSSHDSLSIYPKQLTLAQYTHRLIHLFIPNLWSTTTTTLPVSFDDSDRSLPAKRTEISKNYDAIMTTALEEMISYAKDDTAPFRLKTLTAATRQLYEYMADGKWHNAVKLGMFVLVQYALLYPPFHPMMAQHFLILSKATWNAFVLSETMGKKAEPLVHVYQSLMKLWMAICQDTIANTFGIESEPWSEILDLEQQTQA